jgi:hypothetical protein
MLEFLTDTASSEMLGINDVAIIIDPIRAWRTTYRRQFYRGTIKRFQSRTNFPLPTESSKGRACDEVLCTVSVEIT